MIDQRAQELKRQIGQMAPGEAGQVDRDPELHEFKFLVTLETLETLRLAGLQSTAALCASSASRAASASGESITPGRQHANPSLERRNLKPTKPAVQISDADPGRKCKILITDTGKCTIMMTVTFKKWREKGESLESSPYIYQAMSAKQQGFTDENEA